MKGIKRELGDKYVQFNDGTYGYIKGNDIIPVDEDEAAAHEPSALIGEEDEEDEGEEMIINVNMLDHPFLDYLAKAAGYESIEDVEDLAEAAGRSEMDYINPYYENDTPEALLDALIDHPEDLLLIADAREHALNKMDDYYSQQENV